MSQAGNKKNVDQIGGRFLIQENDHMSEIVKSQNANGNRQAQQGQSSDRQQGSGNQGFQYENPRQVH